MEEDIATGYSVALSEKHGNDAALEDLWIAAGSPQPLSIPKSSFVRAAQRELYMSCGLDIEADRLSYCGYQVLEREDSPVQLGFAIFDVVLSRSVRNDELRTLESWSDGNMLTVALDRLYSDKFPQLPLNRLLRARPEWLKRNVIHRPME